MNALSCVDQCFIADQTLEQLPLPAKLGKTKLSGIDFNKPRMRSVAEAVLALAPSPRGFTASDLAGQVRAFLPSTNSKYTSRQAAYDIKKLRAKQIVQRIGKSQRYEPIPQGIKTIAALVLLP